MSHNKFFSVKENVSIDLEVSIAAGGNLEYHPVGGDSANDWASYSLEADGRLVAEHVSFEAPVVHDKNLLMAWFRQTPGYSGEGDAEDALDELLGGPYFGNPDELYGANVAAARQRALADWLAKQSFVAWYHPLRGFANEFCLTVVLEGAEYKPSEVEYTIDTPEEVAALAFRYVSDPLTEDFSSLVLVW